MPVRIVAQRSGSDNALEWARLRPSVAIDCITSIPVAYTGQLALAHLCARSSVVYAGAAIGGRFSSPLGDDFQGSDGASLYGDTPRPLEQQVAHPTDQRVLNWCHVSDCCDLSCGANHHVDRIPIVLTAKLNRCAA